MLRLNSSVYTCTVLTDFQDYKYWSRNSGKNNSIPIEALSCKATISPGGVTLLSPTDAPTYFPFGIYIRGVGFFV